MLNFKQSTANNKILIIVVFVLKFIYIYYKKIDKNSENIPLIFL